MTILRTHASGLADWTHTPLLAVLGTLLVVLAVWVAPMAGTHEQESTPRG
jgi:hypothetical protein